jgi:hypothetical protein
MNNKNCIKSPQLEQEFYSNREIKKLQNLDKVVIDNRLIIGYPVILLQLFTVAVVTTKLQAIFKVNSR